MTVTTKQTNTPTTAPAAVRNLNDGQQPQRRHPERRSTHERAVRLNTRVQHLEKRLSEALGEQAWHESGLSTPTNIDALNQQITHLEQQAIDLRLQLEEREEDLAATRATNRELMTRINTPHR